MRLECIKYEWLLNTADIDINFFSDVTPIPITTIDLADYYIDGTMGDVEYTFEDITSENTLAVEASALSFNCIDDNYSSVNLIDFFECFESNKYLKWKLNYYDDNDELIYSGIIYKDGITISAIEEKVL